MESDNEHRDSQRGKKASFLLFYKNDGGISFKKG